MHAHIMATFIARGGDNLTMKVARDLPVELDMPYARETCPGFPGIGQLSMPMELDLPDARPGNFHRQLS